MLSYVCVEDSDAEDDDCSDGLSGARDVDGDQKRGLSYLCVSLEVESGLISMLLEVRVLFCGIQIIGFVCTGCG